jgi:hypothetical protein
MTDPSSRQRYKLSNSNKNLVLGPRRALMSKLTARLTVGRNVTLTLTLTLENSTGRLIVLTDFVLPTSPVFSHIPFHSYKLSNSVSRPMFKAICHE